MEQIINYRDIPTDKKTGILNALEQIGFIPAYGGVKTMQRIMEKSIPGSGPQFYFVFSLFRIVCFLIQQYKYTFHKLYMHYKN
mgnify:CR=1 FL=1